MEEKREITCNAYKCPCCEEFGVIAPKDADKEVRTICIECGEAFAVDLRAKWERWDSKRSK